MDFAYSLHAARWSVGAGWHWLPGLHGVLAGLLMLAVTSRGTTIYQHTGAQDPTTEGWVAIGAGTGVTTGAVFNDLGTGTDAWFVNDSSTVGGSFTVYSQTPTAEINTQAATLGWTLSVVLRMAGSSVPSPFDGGVFADYINGTTDYSMSFEREADGDPTVYLLGGGSFTLEGAGDSSYNLFELVYNPAAGSADLFVNGVERVGGYTGTPTALSRVGWGANGSSTTGIGNFSEVSFFVVPEPSRSVMVLLGFSVWLTRRRRGARMP